jgi:glycosyltransferase involved in cell wall biosynthesis
MTPLIEPLPGVTADVVPAARRFAGKRLAMVTFSPYPFDPRPRRAVDALVKEGASIDLICLASDNLPRRQDFNGVNVLRVPLKHLRRGKLDYAFRYLAFICVSAVIFAVRTLARRYDLVYVHNMPDVLVASALIPKLFGAKVILDLHDPMPELMTTIFHTAPEARSVRLLRRLEKWSIGRADLVITVNIACKRIFSQRSCRSEKIAVVMNSPDGAIFPFRAVGHRNVPSQDGARSFVIMYHGSLVDRNGLEVAIDALARVRQTVPNAVLHIFGTSTQFLERMLKKVRDNHLEDRVQYFGPKRLEDLVTEIDKCDIGVIPNHRNAFTDINTPTRIFEYLALGKPVIAPRTPGIQDYFNEESLLFFEPGNADHLARQIEFASSHPEEMLEIARSGQRVYREHSWDQERETLLSRASGILPGAGGSSGSSGS